MVHSVDEYNHRREAFHKRLSRMLEKNGFRCDRYGRGYNVGPLVEFAMNYQLDNESSMEIYRLYTRHICTAADQARRPAPPPQPQSSGCIIT